MSLRDPLPNSMPAFAGQVWETLTAEVPAHAAAFDPSTLDALPPPAQRLLGRALPPGTALSSLVTLQMDGEIKLGGRWFSFIAHQILRSRVGFVWAPVVGGRLVRFVGADVLADGGARMEFRFHNLIPVVQVADDDVLRSAQGRLAAETVAWLPQALTPQAGAQWKPLDDDRAVVTLDAAGRAVDVEVEVDSEGTLRSLRLDRWSTDIEPPGNRPFGGAIGSTVTSDEGVTVAGEGVVGWDWGTAGQEAGRFFRYRITQIGFHPSTCG